MLKIKNLVSVLLLAIFVSVQLMDFHTFTHDDDSVECEICVLSNQQDSLDYDLPAPALIPVTVLHEYAVTMVDYNAFAKAQSYTNFHLSRPPPAIG
jgi:hypothetical protein